MPDSGITVLLVDDDSLVRRGFRRLLEDDPQIRVVADASDGHGSGWRPAVRQYGVSAPGQYHGDPGDTQHGGAGGVCDPGRAGKHRVTAVSARRSRMPGS